MHLRHRRAAGAHAFESAVYGSPLREDDEVIVPLSHLPSPRSRDGSAFIHFPSLSRSGSPFMHLRHSRAAGVAEPCSHATGGLGHAIDIKGLFVNASGILSVRLDKHLAGTRSILYIYTAFWRTTNRGRVYGCDSRVEMRSGWQHV